jgi:hypothetical protein
LAIKPHTRAINFILNKHKSSLNKLSGGGLNTFDAQVDRDNFSPAANDALCFCFPGKKQLPEHPDLTRYHAEL